MVFTAPSWAPSLPLDPPDSIPIHQFQFEEEYGRCKFEYAKNPFTCGLTGKTRSVLETETRFELLAQGLAKDIGWSPNIGKEWDKVVNIFSLNHVDYMVLTWAVHRLNGICAPSSVTCSVSELTHQLLGSQAKAIFTCQALLPKALQAAAAASISDRHVYLLDSPEQVHDDSSDGIKCQKTLDELVLEGMREPHLDALHWDAGQGGRQVAYVCYSSGTSGPPKGVMITHQNMIANVMQASVFESVERHTRSGVCSAVSTGFCLAVLPMSHAHAISISQISTYRGEGMVVLPTVDLSACFEAISRYQIATLWLVPSLLELILRNHKIIRRFDISSVVDVVSGAAPLKKETADELHALFPQWRIRQGYGVEGLTEASTIICFTPKHDIMFGSVGSLLPGFEAKILNTDGEEISEHDVPGELLVRSLSVSSGYYNDSESTQQTFSGGWLRTGDEAMVCLSSLGNEHFVLTDRIKELIKVRGYQVSPSELESFLLTHPAIADCCVVPVSDHLSGEVPKAFIVRAQRLDMNSVNDDDELRRNIQKYVADNNADHKRLKGGVEFINEIPRNPAGKLLRRVLRERG